MSEKSDVKILAIVGMSGSGKSVVVDFLTKKGIPKVYFGGMIYKEMERRGIQRTADGASAGVNEQSGSGLGLYIVKNLLKRYGLKYEISDLKKSFSFKIDFGTLKRKNSCTNRGIKL